MAPVKTKVSKESVDYRRPTTGQHRCSNCVMYHPRYSECDLVKGIIRPEYVCDRWERK